MMELSIKEQLMADMKTAMKAKKKAVALALSVWHGRIFVRQKLTMDTRILMMIGS
ncbi:MAG: hypothetical protein ACLUIQ_01440 [Dialister invisus]